MPSASCKDYDIDKGVKGGTYKSHLGLYVSHRYRGLVLWLTRADGEAPSRTVILLFPMESP